MGNAPHIPGGDLGANTKAKSSDFFLEKHFLTIFFSQNHIKRIKKEDFYKLRVCRPPHPFPLSFAPILVQKDAQCSETYEKTNFQFLVFEI